jgi:cob(I)alamin adenosyltransferase
LRERKNLLTAGSLKEESFNSPGGENRTQRGLVEIYTGNGKGKTTAALGTAIRALGHEHKVYIVFFLKGDYPYGERNTLSHLPNVTFVSYGTLKFIDPENITEEERREAALAFASARQAVTSGKYDLIILDEINLAVYWKLISLEEVMKLIGDKPEKVELILTGRFAAPELIRLADLVTECHAVKHPYDAGILARPGIEY